MGRNPDSFVNAPDWSEKVLGSMLTARRSRLLFSSSSDRAASSARSCCLVNSVARWSASVPTELASVPANLACLPAVYAEVWAVPAATAASFADVFAVPASRIADAASSSASVILSDSCARSSASTSDTLLSPNVSTTIPATIINNPKAANGTAQCLRSSWVSSWSILRNLSRNHRLILMKVSGASIVQPTATAYPPYFNKAKPTGATVFKCQTNLVKDLC